MNARGVKIELDSERRLLLPFDHFMFSEIRNMEGGEELQAVFVTHRILVRGSRLERIEDALQRKELSYLRSVPRKLESLVPEDQPVVRNIVAEETDEPQSVGPEGERE